MKETNTTLIKKLALLAVQQIAPSHGDCEPLNRIVRIAELMERCERAESLGMQAGMVKMPRIPVKDEYVMQLIDGMSVGDGAEEIFRAWGKGWDAAQVNA